MAKCNQLTPLPFKGLIRTNTRQTKPRRLALEQESITNGVWAWADDWLLARVVWSTLMLSRFCLSVCLSHWRLTPY